MQISSEIFVMVVFIIGFPIVCFTLRDSELPESHLFRSAYLLLVFSNISTVAEELCLFALFNLLEHLFIAAASILSLLAVTRLTSASKAASRARADGTTKK